MHYYFFPQNLRQDIFYDSQTWNSKRAYILQTWPMISEDSEKIIMELFDVHKVLSF